VDVDARSLAVAVDIDVLAARVPDREARCSPVRSTERRQRGATAALTDSYESASHLIAR